MRHARDNEAAVPWRADFPPTRRRRRRRWIKGLAPALALVILGGIGWVVYSQGGWTKDRFARLVHQRPLPAVQATTAGAHKFIATLNGSPVSYNPCQPIRYELNATKAPPGSEGVLSVAIQRVQSATGLKFEYVGTTERRPLYKAPSIYGPASPAPPVVISWATAKDAPALAGDVAGYAGSSYLADGLSRHFVTGLVVLDSDVYTRLLQTPAGSEQARAITMHELGHLVGLDHVADSSELMNAKNLGLLDFGPGDLEGLAKLGQGSC